MNKRKVNLLLILSSLLVWMAYSCQQAIENKEKPRIIVSTDIGGTDPDDFQSMIHLLMYADLFQIEGLVSTSFKTGTT
ncbi:MAG: DUF1593 domain-containing protein, partial [Cyclobacteriaceae bacterium]